MPTLQDVALSAGVSTATVSRVINGQPHVKPAVAEAVIRAISELGYEPNYSAKSLRTSKTRKLIMTVPTITNSFFASVIRAAQVRAQIAGYNLVLGNSGNNGELEDVYAQMLLSHEADGLIFLGRHLPESLLQLAQIKGANMPAVNFCEHCDDIDLTSVNVDDKAAATTAMEYLYSLGHKRIGIITGLMDGPISRDRLEGVYATADKHGLRHDLVVLTGDYSARSGALCAAAVGRMLPRPTAIFCFGDEMAAGAIHEIGKMGLSCPEDISVMGFDDMHLAEFLNPSLTTIRQPAETIGVKAVELVLAALDEKLTERTRVTLEHKLVVRNSTRQVLPSV